MEYTFQKAQLTEHEMLWLREVYQSQEFDVKKTKVKLYGRLPKNFDVSKIDRRLYQYDHLTLVGIYLLDPSNKIFGEVELVISKIKEMIHLSPGIDKVSAAELAEKTGLEERDVEIGLRLMADLGKFSGHATYGHGNIGYSSITFSSADDGYDAYLSFESLNDLMEEFYLREQANRTGGGAVNWTWPTAMPGIIANEEIKQKSNTAFIIMPIDPDDSLMVDVYSGIKDVCAKFGISAVRADDIEHQESITDVVLRQISECEFLIADLSHERPNVYYEIGYAHAINKHPILYRSQGTKLHFDLAVHNVPEYKNATELKAKLEKRFEEILGRKAKLKND